MNKRLSRIGKSIATWGIALVGVPSAVGFAIDKLQKSASALFISADAEGVPLEKGSYLIDYSIMFVVALLLVAAALSLLWLWYGHDDAVLQRAKLEAEKATLDAQQALANEAAASASAQAARDNLSAAQADMGMQSAYDQMCRSIQRVVFNGYNPVDSSLEPPPPVRFKKIHCVFDVAANGDAKVTQTYEVEAGDAIARFWVVRLDSDKYAEAFKTLKSIDFEATSTTSGAEIVAIPIDNEGFNRSVAIFFLPEITPRDTRQFTIVFDWPGWFGELPATGVTEWLWSYQSAPSTDGTNVTFSFRFAVALGPISCENVRHKLASETLTPSTEGGGTIWTYKNGSNPVARLNWALRFRITASAAAAAAAAGSN